jgi:hypothetical protein
VEVIGHPAEKIEPDVARVHGAGHVLQEPLMIPVIREDVLTSIPPSRHMIDRVDTRRNCYARNLPSNAGADKPILLFGG